MHNTAILQHSGNYKRNHVSVSFFRSLRFFHNLRHLFIKGLFSQLFNTMHYLSTTLKSQLTSYSKVKKVTKLKCKNLKHNQQDSFQHHNKQIFWAIFTFIWKLRDFIIFFPCAPLQRNTRCAIDSLSAIFCYICLSNVKSNEPKSKKGNKCYLVYWYGTIPTQTKHTFCVIRQANT